MITETNVKTKPVNKITKFHARGILNKSYILIAVLKKMNYLKNYYRFHFIVE
jgi:hypothetical protein